MFIDTHAHLNYTDKYGDTDTLIADILGAGVKKVIDVGWDLPSSRLAAAQAENYPCLFFAAGFHPSNLEDYEEKDLGALAALLERAPLTEQPLLQEAPGSGFLTLLVGKCRLQ